MAPHTPEVLRFGKLSKKPVAPAGYKNKQCRKQTSVLSGRIVTAYVPLRSATERERAAFLIPCQGLRDYFTNSQFIIKPRCIHTGAADCRQNAFGQHSRSVFLVLGSKSVYLINNKHFWVPLFPFLAIIFASFFRFMQANVSPTFISIRAFPIICV